MSLTLKLKEKDVGLTREALSGKRISLKFKENPFLETNRWIPYDGYLMRYGFFSH